MKHCLSKGVDRKTPFLRILQGCQLLFVFLCLCIHPALAQQRTVTGTVRSGDKAVPGVTVQVKGSARATQTDENGRFSLEAPLNSVLIFSSIGYERQEVKAGNALSLSVDMSQTSSDNLNDVIVVGYGTQKKSDVTGSVSSVNLKDVAKTPSPRVDDALQGRVAGVIIQHTDAQPDASILIRIRGANSINGGNDPLVVIDGLQQAGTSSLSTLAPSDVESIEVLKDASATAIYGSRGANGVILVTTKTGRRGKSIISLDILDGFPSVRKKLPVMNSYQYATTVNENRVEFGLNPVFSPAQLSQFQAGYGTNWQDAIFRTGNNQNYNLGISGGNENTTFFISGNVLDNKGIILNTDYKRYSLRSNITSKIGNKLTIGANLFLSREVNHPTPLNGFSNGSPVFSALVFAPTKPIFDSSGNYSQPGGGYGPPTNYNPVALAQTPIKDYYTNSTDILSYLEYNVIPGLKINISGGYLLSDVLNNDYENNLPTLQPGTQYAGISTYHTITYQNTNQISYERKISDHYLKFTGVVEQQYQTYAAATTASVGFLTDALTYNDLGVGSNPQQPYSYANNRSLLSYMGRLNYGYKDILLLTLTERADGSSVFGANNKWGYFPSAAIGWNLLNEKFMQGVRTSLTNLKIRASYGVVGNQAISPYQSLASLNSGLPYDINGTSLAVGVGLGGLANPNLKWEKTAQADVGVDLEMLNGRLDFTGDYYSKKTTDLLLNVPTPLDQGGNGGILENVGTVTNKGVELSLGGRPIAGRDLTWQTTFTFGLNRNKVVYLADGLDSISLGGPGLPNFGNTIWLQVGQPLGLFKGYVYEGVWKSGEASQAASFGVIPGAPKYADEDHDGKITPNDIVNIGNAQPKFSFGWSNTVNFKNFDLNIFIQGVQGNKIYNISRVRYQTTSSDADATSPVVLDRWSPTNENTDIPSFTGSEKYENLQSSRWLEDGSYIRLKNISLGYTLPVSLSGNLKISSLRFYVSGTNLITWTKYTGFDPEAATGVDAYSGVDLATYPSQKVITIGLNLKF